MVGSEGGWSEKEMALFDSLSGNSDKVVNVCLGSGSVLRAETAAVMAVGCLNISAAAAAVARARKIKLDYTIFCPVYFILARYI